MEISINDDSHSLKTAAVNRAASPLLKNEVPLSIFNKTFTIIIMRFKLNSSANLAFPLNSPDVK